MNHAEEKHLGELADICDVCGVELNPETMVGQEYLGKLLTFCSDEHLKEYLADPAKYAEVEEPLE